ncbi:hypothetical protein BFP70_05100 [Thioclava sp. SK-1]|uniref:CpsD/CapB family tyrosine-protein kinase n=1 Tax=Thioclava sp. SK-1 TaxID=1889770 RepID=UPI000824AD42|nr:CpsD/CapB family tyrosine-protein kinase [Thioclava sp. SK-1]OCX66403.1 hypothetical protein BFP70_05100 [Thioclava sp. SK-1]
MEKLQKALEKARANRVSHKAGPAANKTGAEPEQTPNEVSDLWADLTELKLDPKVLMQNRIVSGNGRADSTHYDLLRTKLREESRRRGFSKIAIVSAGPGAGKSTTVANLAFSFGRLPFMRTLVCDFDLRHPSLHRLLGQTPAADMGAVINDDFAFKDHVLRHGNNLAFGMNRSSVANPSELLQSDRTQDFLEAVQATYQPDLMLFDMPPFLLADDTHGFLRQVDAVVLVIEAEVTPRAQIDLVEQKLSELTTVLGIVLNKCHFPDESDAASYSYY